MIFWVLCHQQFAEFIIHRIRLDKGSKWKKIYCRMILRWELIIIIYLIVYSSFLISNTFFWFSRLGNSVPCSLLMVSMLGPAVEFKEAGSPLCLPQCIHRWRLLILAKPVGHSFLIFWDFRGRCKYRRAVTGQNRCSGCGGTWARRFLQDAVCSGSCLANPLGFSQCGWDNAHSTFFFHSFWSIVSRASDWHIQTQTSIPPCS